jgi:hypothetical protein
VFGVSEPANGSQAEDGQPPRPAPASAHALNRSITAPGGTLRLIADFGSEQLKIAQAAVSQ